MKLECEMLDEAKEYFIMALSIYKRCRDYREAFGLHGLGDAVLKRMSSRKTRNIYQMAFLIFEKNEESYEGACE